jgi:para-aminobenzoate synthetase component 1
MHDKEGFFLSASPERFCKLNNNLATLEPMKGTRPRGRTLAEERNYRQELQHSAKEKAELLMVTDLARNDLGKVCKVGSVKVKQLRRIQKYHHLFQASAVVEGMIRKNVDKLDLLEAVFPAGSVTGCPKLEAMRIIKRLEKGSRGIYTGAMGYIKPDQQMDFNVAIRTIVARGKEISFHVGSGIVADSDPDAEYEETLVKAMPMISALKDVLG